MKAIFKIGFLFLYLSTSLGCKTSFPSTAEVSYLATANGVIQLRSIGYGKTDTECLDNAQKNAFEILFYRGIPGSQQNTPLLETTKKENSNYMEDFYSGSRYKTFLTNIAPNYDYQKIKGGKKLSVDLGINLAALRSDLEKSNVIRKFGY